MLQRISRRRLALWLAFPAIWGEFDPVQPFEDGSEKSLEAPWPVGDSRTRDLRGEFLDSLRRAVGDSEGIAVATSGGLDSFAVLANTLIEFGHERRIAALTTELIDDTGKSNVPIVRALLDGLGIPCDLHVLPADERPIGKPEWHPDGPRSIAIPDSHLLVTERAHAAGAAVLLSGDGADQIMESTQFLTPMLLRKGRWAALPKYWWDQFGQYHPTVQLEAAALISSVLSPRHRTMLYLACSHPGLCLPPTHEYLAEPFRSHVDDWTHSFVRSVVERHEKGHTSLAEMEAWSALYPDNPLPESHLIRLGHPYLDTTFLEYAKRLPLDQRYDHRYRHTYWRMKSQVMKLMPKGAIGYLPTRKQIFRNAIGSQLRSEALPAKHLLENGIVEKSVIEGDLDIGVTLRIAEVERWLAEALERGYEMVD
ncbi:asparagine synthase-related protein [Nocardia abscessus]|uniref:asparagine synthase-related protein n=1 Tax=Nocardia abscessus TaxID=120957 RepID=UPI0024564679|nr:asparagine synthase-related protein [Nocardia abscessus]